MRKRVAAVALAALALTGCSSQDSGDAAACAAFTEATRTARDARDALLGPDADLSEQAKAAHREASASLGDVLRSAASLATDDELATDLDDAAMLWAASSSSDDAATAYFLTEARIQEAC
ncbi:hypothetical protein ASE27_10130 [Oerskovia sp. Root918]|uniref:hypothetical protein n=1 Tax=Oerskovia sp. Root918 TaxID=1736607 RepID=UPI0006FAEF72|nr:hypothetical protein [Oerskovia sp. Root918]KRD36804.1 hypothetical protein ASE27_10130 [Oerskovia sp. Root918]